MFVSDLQQVCGFHRVLNSVSSTNKTDRHDIDEILLKMGLSAIKQTIYAFIVAVIIYRRRNSLFMFLSVEIPRRKWLDTAGNMAYQHPGICFLYPGF
jgi:hypothetical protein